jgi:hypothetical protein
MLLGVLRVLRGEDLRNQLQRMPARVGKLSNGQFLVFINQKSESVRRDKLSESSCCWLETKYTKLVS